MGNDLLIATLAIEKEKSPDWDAAYEHVQCLTKEQIEGLEEAFDQWAGETPVDADGELDVEEMREQLHNLVGDVKAAVESESRHTFGTDYIVPGWTVYLTGGDSWGDAPTEEWDLFATFHATGLAKVAGFATEGF
jgi:hypothetical protein